MSENVLGTNVVCQVAVVVRDVERAAKAWAAILGVEPPAWRLTDPAEKSHIRYRGQATEGRAKLAFFSLGPQVRLELIEPVGGPSTWREFLDRYGQGIHHMAFQIKGMDEVLARLDAQQITLVQRGDYTGGRYAYVDGLANLGAILELLENLDH
ncbi:MAG: VOC family protein [Chloroflexi bacterium]|nr:VOC family protein [Chloroflexota bacterium]